MEGVDEDGGLRELPTDEADVWRETDDGEVPVTDDKFPDDVLFKGKAATDKRETDVRVGEYDKQSEFLSLVLEKLKWYDWGSFSLRSKLFVEPCIGVRAEGSEGVGAADGGHWEEREEQDVDTAWSTYKWVSLV